MSDNYQPRNPYAPNYGARPAGNYGAAPYGQAPYAPSSAPAAPSAPASSYPGGYNNGANYTSNSSDNKKSSPGWGGVMALSLTTALVASGITAGGMYYTSDMEQAQPAITSTSTVSANNQGNTKLVTTQGQTPDWQKVAENVSSSVVYIQAKLSEGGASGSGVVIDKQGHIITNNHVVAGASALYAQLKDGRIYELELTGTDPANDLAVVKIKNAPSDLTVAQIGSSKDLKVGQGVMAIGAPLGLSSTATTGIISALDRPVVTKGESSDDSSGSSANQRVYTNAIQVDAAINPGNSGGPLFDSQGRVIGINSSIATLGSSSSSGTRSGNIGIGFAIPIDLANKVAQQLIKDGKATHAYLGVSLEDGGATVNGETRAGAKITKVGAGSPAANAGLREGDVILAVDGHAVGESVALMGYVRQFSAGDQVKLTVARGSNKMDVTVKLVERPDDK